MAGVLVGVISQRLLPKVGGGRLAAVEVMVSNSRIADLIREAKAEEIPEAIAEGSFFQMQTFSDALLELVLSGRVEREVAANAASNRHDFEVALDHALKARAAAARAEEAARVPEESPDAVPELRVVGPTP
jgi:twitching motility protein PilT